MSERCEVCGVEVPPGVSLHRHRVSFRRRAVRCCSACRDRRQRREERAAWIGLLVFLMLVVGLRLFLSLPADPVLFFFLNMLLLVFFEALIVWPHEAAHALAAWAVGMPVFAIHIGWGRVLFAARFRRTQFTLGAVQGGGVVFVGYPRVKWLRARAFLMTLAGPLANAVLLAGTFLVCTPGELLRGLGALESQVLPLQMFALSNLLTLPVALFPWRWRTGWGTVSSDGLNLLTFLFLSTSAARQLHVNYFIAEANHCMSSRQYQEALSCYAEAHRTLRKLLDETDLPDSVRALTADTLAENLLESWVVFQELGTVSALGSAAPEAPSLLDQAEHWCREALQYEQALPHESQASCQATYACVLIERGKVTEGMHLLESILPGMKRRFDRAYSLGYLAVSAARQGRLEEGRALWEQAKALDPACAGVRRAGAELARAALVLERGGAASNMHDGPAETISPP